MTIDRRRFAKPAAPDVFRCKWLAVVVPRLIFLARSMSMSENGQTFAFAVDRLSRSAINFNPGIELYGHGHRRRDPLSSTDRARSRVLTVCSLWASHRLGSIAGRSARPAVPAAIDAGSSQIQLWRSETASGRVCAAGPSWRLGTRRSTPCGERPARPLAGSRPAP